MRSARDAEPELAEGELIALIAGNTGTPARLIRTAIRYWSSHPEEIDAEVTAAATAESGWLADPAPVPLPD